MAVIDDVAVEFALANVVDFETAVRQIHAALTEYGHRVAYAVAQMNDLAAWLRRNGFEATTRARSSRRRRRKHPVLRRRRR